ncbi:hypothetical protein HMPREF3202_00185 [Prevotella bivia]|uniref:Uncharacterized protein n=1 Tax=Prevotella bivia TaxID=28125 RepID=A0A137T108_9BACT|nr:hypothetical protein HMPREF3202_00185 [Prevotella bivia]
MFRKLMFYLIKDNVLIGKAIANYNIKIITSHFSNFLFSMNMTCLDTFSLL